MVGVMGPRTDEDCESRVVDNIGREVIVQVERWVDTCGMAGSRLNGRASDSEASRGDYLSMTFPGSLKAVLGSARG